MQLQEFLNSLIPHELNPGQVENVNKILRISEKFHRDVGIPFPEIPEITSKTIVLESGHQPNFLPHSGTWKKPFLLDFLGRKIENSLSLFGFADYNLSTARILYQSSIPALTKTGSEKIGFKIPEKDKWKRFNTIEKPSEQEFEREIDKIRNHYGNEPNLKGFETMIRKSYEKAGNLADLNSFTLSGICTKLWNLNTIFFRYTDVQKEKIFMDEWKAIISNLSPYNQIYNKVVRERNFEDIRPVNGNSIPFWYHCSCGCKIPLSMSSGKFTGKCTVCQKDYSLSLEDDFSDMSPNAVSRNLVFSQGLGTSLFISGSGGGLRYGKISDEISRDIKFNNPSTVTWKGRDYYLGSVHRAALKELTKILGTDSMEKLSLRIKNKKEELMKKIMESGEDIKAKQKYQGQLVNLNTRLTIAEEIFSLIPSFLDEFISLGGEKVLNSWKKALENSGIVEKDGIYVIQKDVIQDNNAQKIYESLGG